MEQLVGKRSYPLSSPDTFTLQLNAQVDVSINNRICSKCWDRHRDHAINLDGRTRTVPPTSSSSPLDALLSAAISPLPPSPAPLTSPSVASLSSPPPALARVITPSLAYPIVSNNPTLIRHQYSSSPTTVVPQSNNTQHFSPLPVARTPLLLSSTCLPLPPPTPSANGMSLQASWPASTMSATACRR